MLPRPVLIMAGGTGGHVYPALAVADYLRQKQVPLFWLGTRKGLEARVVPARGYTLLTITIGGLRGKGLYKWLQAPFILVTALLQVLCIYIRIKPAAVLGMGGFVSGPGGLAAWLLRIPLCIHEQNAIAGLTNRLLAPLAHTVMQAFPDTFPEKFNAQLIGNPVRGEICAIRPPEQRIHSGSNDALKVLILGGSQGASALNRIIPETLPLLGAGINLSIRHQTGPDHHAKTVARYQSLQCQVELLPYIDDMAAAYAWADLVICRAGALTLAELTAAGVASVLVPYPHAVDDHQTANARHLSEQGAALLIQEHDLTPDLLARLLMDFHHARPRLLSMSQRARQLAKPEATADVAGICLRAAYAG